MKAKRKPFTPTLATSYWIEVYADGTCYGFMDTPQLHLARFRRLPGTRWQKVRVVVVKPQARKAKP